MSRDALEHVFVGATSVGDLYVECYECCWIHYISGSEPSDIAALSTLARGHHCQPAVVDGSLVAGLLQ